MARGLYELIGDGPVTSEKIEDFLVKNSSLDSETRERLLAWKAELEFWESYNKNFSGSFWEFYEKSPLYQDLIGAIGNLIEPKKDEVWLDVGCGTLSGAELIWEKSRGEVKKIYGVDIILTQAKARLGQLGDLMPIELKYANLGEKLPFPDNFFNGIVANHVLPFIIEFEGEKGKEALKGVLKEIFRILKPGGVLVWTTPKKNASSFLGFLAALAYILNPHTSLRFKIFAPLAATRLLRHFRGSIRKGRKGIYNYLAKEEYEDLLRSAGYINSHWKTAFGGQSWVNKAEKPNVTLSNP